MTTSYQNHSIEEDEMGPALKTACTVKKAMKKSRNPPMRRMSLQAMHINFSFGQGAFY